MRIFFTSAVFLLGSLAFAQTQQDTLKHEKIKEVVVIAKKPTVETKVDRTIFNVANSSVIAGNTTWDVLRMTPLVSIDNNDVIRAEGENVTVYINDRKTVFTGKELKEYLQTIPADNLIKIEVITNPSSRYESSGSVINIVLKKKEDEGIKGSVSLTNTQYKKNTQYSNGNLNYHKKKFTQTVTGSYNNTINIEELRNINTLYESNAITDIFTETMRHYYGPSLSSTSEFELDNKNNIGIILEYSKYNWNKNSDALAREFLNGLWNDAYQQNQNSDGTNKRFGTNLFYKLYDKEKNRILDINVGYNYFGKYSTQNFIKNVPNFVSTEEIRILNGEQTRNYYIKVDYTTPIWKSGGTLEMGFKTDFNNNRNPNDYLNLLSGNWQNDVTRTNRFRYQDNLNSIYANYNQTFLKNLETRIGLRYEYISYQLLQEIGNIGNKNSYGIFLPDILLKYSFSKNYDLSLNYKRNIWRPEYSEFNPFLMPTDNGIYYRGNMNLKHNPSDKFGLKLGIKKKYFVSVSYWFTNQDYWDTFYVEDGKTISMPENFKGLVERYVFSFNTNQIFLKNKLNVNLSVNFNYINNKDFNEKNNLNARNSITDITGSTNISYTNLFGKNINANAWVGVFTQNQGNSYTSGANIFHSFSFTKIFPKTSMEANIRFYNIFLKPKFNSTNYSPVGTFQNIFKWDWYGISLTFIKRFGNQKVKENSKVNVEKIESGGK